MEQEKKSSDVIIEIITKLSEVYFSHLLKRKTENIDKICGTAISLLIVLLLCHAFLFLIWSGLQALTFIALSAYGISTGIIILILVTLNLIGLIASICCFINLKKNLVHDI